jgi:hypothetical protein
MLFNALWTSDFTEISKTCHQTVNQIIQIVHGWFALETSKKLHGWKDQLTLLFDRRPDYLKVSTHGRN